MSEECLGQSSAKLSKGGDRSGTGGPPQFFDANTV